MFAMPQQLSTPGGLGKNLFAIALAD